MAVSFNFAKELEADKAGERFTVTERLFIDPDGKVVREDEAINGGRLLFRAGDVIRLEEAVKHGLAKAIEPEEPKTPDAPKKNGKKTDATDGGK